MSTKLMLQLYKKLKIGFHEAIYDFLEMIILDITPLDPAFKKFFGALELIQDHHRRYVEEEVRVITPEYCQNYL